MWLRNLTGRVAVFHTVCAGSSPAEVRLIIQRASSLNTKVMSVAIFLRHSGCEAKNILLFELGCGVVTGNLPASLAGNAGSTPACATTPFFRFYY